MDISSISQQSLSSLKQALSIATLKKSMNQDVMSVTSLINGMKEANSKSIEHSVTPHKGSSIDIKV